MDIAVVVLRLDGHHRGHGLRLCGKQYAVCVGFAVAVRSLPVGFHGEVTDACYGYSAILLINLSDTVALLDAPVDRAAAGTACRAQVERITVADISRLVGNGQGILAGGHDLEGAGYRRGKLVVAARVVCDGDGVFAHRDPGRRKRYCVLALRDDTAPGVCHSDGRGLFRAVVLNGRR